MDRQFLILLFWILPLSTWADQHLKMDTSEVTIAEFSEFADTVGLLTKAEKEGGMVYESGWVTKKGWKDRKSTRLNSSHSSVSRMPSSA